MVILQFDLTTVADVLQIIFADIILSGDNALVIGMAAAGLAADQRKKAIAIGMVMAAVMRILFAIIATYLLAIRGILLIGGLLLSWVCGLWSAIVGCLILDCCFLSILRRRCCMMGLLS